MPNTTVEVPDWLKQEIDRRITYACKLYDSMDESAKALSGTREEYAVQQINKWLPQTWTASRIYVLNAVKEQCTPNHHATAENAS